MGPEKNAIASLEQRPNQQTTILPSEKAFFTNEGKAKTSETDKKLREFVGNRPGLGE